MHLLVVILNREGLLDDLLSGMVEMGGTATGY